jgi:hypothetical protein
MSHDVFLSYSSKDKYAADAACAVLERNGIRVWMAPRDILPGLEWSASIMEAVNKARVMVLVFSGNANTSKHIGREVERAISKGLPVIPFRIEDIEPSESMEYFISAQHWLDAFTKPLEQHLDRLADNVRRLIDAKYPKPELSAEKKVLGPEHPETAAGLDNRALQLQAEGDLAGARLLYEHALAMYEKAIGPEHPATVRNNLAGLLHDQSDLVGEPTHDHGKHATDSKLLEGKREAIIPAVSKKVGTTIIRKTGAFFWDSSHTCRVVCTISKRLPGHVKYWYAYHPAWDAFLSEGTAAFFVLGCMDQQTAFVIPFADMHSAREYMNKTEPKDGQMYWHVHLVENAGVISMLLPKKGESMSLEPYRVALEA